MTSRQSRQHTKRYLYRTATLAIIIIVATVASIDPLWPGTLSGLPNGLKIFLFAIGVIGAIVAGFKGFGPDNPSAQNDEGRPLTPYDFNSPQHRRNRENVIANLRSGYIEGVLHQSMPEQVRLNLGLEQLPDMIMRREARWEGQSRPLPVSTSDDILRLYNEGGRSLLILGAPGAGKTIAMLELCDRMLQDATSESDEPIPVVINLSSWANEQKPLVDWLADEMDHEYGLPKLVTPYWLDKQQLCIMLDGLDEVRKELREGCINAINDFRSIHATPTVVCSRITDYEELSARLNLSRALFIQPLDERQIESYLLDPKLRLEAVFDALQRDDALAELASTPLMLNVIGIAYGGITLSEFKPLFQNETFHRREIYDCYIERVFQRRLLTNKQYNAGQALLWLRFLAKQITARAQTQFFIEDLQFNWLPRGESTPMRLLAAILFGVVFATLMCLLIGSLFSARFGVLTGIISGILASASILSAYTIRPVDVLLLENLSARSISKAIVNLDNLYAIATGLRGGILVGVAIGVAVGNQRGMNFGITVGVLSSVIFGLLYGVVTEGLTKVHPLESKRRTYPNQGIHRSSLNSLRLAIVTGVSMGLLAGMLAGVSTLIFDDVFNRYLVRAMEREFSAGLLAGQNSALVVGASVGIFVGILTGVGAGLHDGGGNAVINHYSLRSALARHGHLPWRIVPFMEDMKDRILIQRTASSYRFIHRTLQEHIANLSDEDIDRILRR